MLQKCHYAPSYFQYGKIFGNPAKRFSRIKIILDIAKNIRQMLTSMLSFEFIISFKQFGHSSAINTTDPFASEEFAKSPTNVL